MLLRLINYVNSMWAWIGNNDKQLLICFAVIAGVYALFQFWDSEKAAKQQEVAHYVSLFGSSNLMQARVDMEAFQNGPEVAPLKRDTYDAVVGKKVADKAFLSMVVTQLNFFDSLSLCVAGGQCDKDSACRYFFNDAEGFLQNARPVLNRLGYRTSRGPDAYLKDFAHQQCSANLKTYCSDPSIGNRSVDCQQFR